MGMPGLSGFIAEFPIMSGVWKGPLFSADTLHLAYFPTFNYYPIIAISGSAGHHRHGCLRIARDTASLLAATSTRHAFPGIRGIRLQDKIAISLLVWCAVVRRFCSQVP